MASWFVMQQDHQMNVKNLTNITSYLVKINDITIKTLIERRDGTI